jgi:hypothetical protein
LSVRAQRCQSHYFSATPRRFYTSIRSTYLCRFYTFVRSTYLCRFYTSVRSTYLCRFYTSVRSTYLCRFYTSLRSTYLCRLYTSVRATYLYDRTHTNFPHIRVHSAYLYVHTSETFHIHIRVYVRTYLYVLHTCVLPTHIDVPRVCVC